MVARLVRDEKVVGSNPITPIRGPVHDRAFSLLHEAETTVKQAVAETIHETLTSEDDGRVCRDIPEEACDEQPGNFSLHVASLTATKTGDGLADPKLVLAWLLTALGAPAGLVGLLVPIREAGALLPQLMIAGRIRSMKVRKWAWATGSAVQGLCVAGMAIAAWSLEGAAAGWTILGLLAVFATARSVCSVSYKDVLGKTVSKATRGTATGTAATLASASVLGFGILVSFDIVPLTVPSIATVLLIAAGLWLGAAAMFTRITEADGATEGGGNALRVAIEQFSLLKTDPQLTRFIFTRGLLLSTALAPPYMLALSGRSEDAPNGQLGELGPFVVASSVAGLISSYLWGRLSDRSSRKVLMLAGLIASAALGGSAAVGWASIARGEARVWVFSGLLFVLMLAYRGVRIGRSTHIVDMATEDTRAAYTALSNTMIGVLLLIAGGFAAVAQWFGTELVLALFAAMALGATLVASGLNEVQQGDHSE